MKRSLLLVIAMRLFLPGLSLAQEYSYTHYDISDGLAGSTIYCITQDKDGFIWMGTETGVSRFDGTNFHNYTEVDGLPDVEILQMFGDSKGRVWMAPFRNSICYYYKGKIYNQQNDSLLHTLQFYSNIDNFAEDRKGNILVQERTALHLLRTDGSTRLYDSVQGRPVRNCAAVTLGLDGNFLVQIDQEVFRLTDTGFIPLFPVAIQVCWPGSVCMTTTGMIWWDHDHTFIRSFISGKTAMFPFAQTGFQHVYFSSLDDTLYYNNELLGATEYNLYTGGQRLFLPGRKVSRAFRDAAGNTWFTTLGQGLYRLNSDEFRTIHLSAPGKRPSGIWAIGRVGGQLLVGGDDQTVFAQDSSDTRRWRVLRDSIANVRIVGFGQSPNGKTLVMKVNHMIEVSGNFQRCHELIVQLRTFFRMSTDKMLIGAAWGAGIVDLKSFRLTDTLWHDRVTALYYRRDTIYIGTQSGLYAICKDKSVIFLGKEIAFLQKRISSIAESADGTLWIASYDGGLIGYKNRKVITTLSKRQGLSSDICRTLLIHGRHLWVGTDKGLNKISIDQPDYPVMQYTSQDGLGSNIVNCIYADGEMIYVGTDAGLSFFNENKVNASEECRLYLLSIQNEGKERIADSASLVVPFTDKHLRFEFAGISYRSVGGITYRYRLLGLDSNWRTTKETFLEYLTLLSGRYQLQLQATNKFDRKSDLLSLSFTVATPWWQTIWFKVLAFCTAVFVTWLFVSLRIRGIRNRQKEKEKLNHRMIELENMALQAQMNPHFIFNCLNSIQQNIFDQDIFSANKYITGFARLVRSTLQHSSKQFIPLGEEIEYLSEYLAMEKLRFKDKMDYTIEADAELRDSQFILPPMLIQPFAENSVRHGLRHKTDGKGYIHIKFRRAGNRLTVIVEDNGIGRKKAAAYKTREHIEYQSKGMTLTADRIRMINVKYQESIRTEVTDLEDEAGRPAGTRVTIEFPLFHLIKNDTI